MGEMHDIYVTQGTMEKGGRGGEDKEKEEV